MEQRFNVIGMSCLGCKTNIEEALSDLHEVKKVTVDLKNKGVMVEMTSFQSSSVKGWSLLCFASAEVQMRRNAVSSPIYFMPFTPVARLRFI